MEVDRTPLSSTEAARAVGVHVGTVRRWERAGLIFPLRTAGGHRRFGASDLRRLEVLAGLRVEERPLAGLVGEHDHD